MQRRNVVFPEPEGPRSTTTSPRRTSMSMPLSTSVPWNALVTLTAWTRGASVGRGGRCGGHQWSASILASFCCVFCGTAPKPRPKYRSSRDWPTMRIEQTMRYQSVAATMPGMIWKVRWPNW